MIPLRGSAREIEPWSAEGDHGGGDRLMLEDIFSTEPAPDKYLRAADERAKPNGERLDEFRDSTRESLELNLFSSEPVYDDLELLTLTDSLTDLAGKFGADDPLVKTVLNNKSPVERASELIKGTQLKDVAFRKKLYGGGKAAIDGAADATEG